VNSTALARSFFVEHQLDDESAYLRTFSPTHFQIFSLTPFHKSNTLQINKPSTPHYKPYNLFT